MTELDIKKHLAVVILSYSDYESLELALAAHSKFFDLDDEVKFYILQNGRGTYDCERTLKVALRFQDLFPQKIKVITDISPKIPYFAIQELLHKPWFSDVDYIIKLDDDVFPLTPNWITQLCKCYSDSYQIYGDSLAYVTSLVNNNPYGFRKTLEILGLQEEFFNKVARDHFVGFSAEDPYSPYRILPKDQISTGGGGTIWRYPYIARWLHKQTTLNVENFVNSTSNLGYEKLNSKERYSINCLLFKKNFWDDIRGRLADTDDELLCQKYFIHNKKEIVANLAVPMVHLFFYTHREENKDLIDTIREYYEPRWNLPYPISINTNRTVELENRLRFLENKFTRKSISISARSHVIGKLRNYVKKTLKPDSFAYKLCRRVYQFFC